MAHGCSNHGIVRCIRGGILPIDFVPTYVYEDYLPNDFKALDTYLVNTDALTYHGAREGLRASWSHQIHI